ncbi:hypothetical protein PI124_g10215 [Phytophthora idaei]|nr:hypothetical protein PI125_g15698 [Phytophthora idaei]KAG3245029.1 hypothetical protein PI124_g10215 [Phytophthora idaei]
MPEQQYREVPPQPADTGPAMPLGQDRKVDPYRQVKGGQFQLHRLLVTQPR